MKTEENRMLNPRFDAEVRFELKPQPKSRKKMDRLKEDFDALQERLENSVLRESINPRLHSAVSMASNEAAAVAWTTRYPLLVMPGLFEEKLRVRLLWQQRQDRVQFQGEALVEAL